MEWGHEPLHCRSVVALAALTCSAAHATEYSIVPDPTLTPGAVRTTDPVEICEHSTREYRHWSREADDRILIAYGLPPGPHPEVEIDHLIPLGVGGADDDRNKWPEPRRSVEPVWNAEAKDRLELKLYKMICAGGIDPVEAQAEFTNDWTEAYRKIRLRPALK